MISDEDDELALNPSSSGTRVPSTPPVKTSLVLFHFTIIIFYT